MVRRGSSTQTTAATTIEAPRLQELDRLYREYRSYVRHYVLRTFGRGPPDPDDVVQAAFERFANLEEPSLVSNPKAFLVTSARNYVIDERRRQVVRARHVGEVQHFGSECDDLDAERVLSGKERLDILDRAIRGMDERRRELLIMNRIHGLSFAEISRRKGYSQTLVKNLVAQALLICERALREGS